ncbi:hypothetical protein I7I53_04846 [Histoplasma capsulatum var. duboisii H88]|uniref:Uncharacterized protein n=1 Tax=Ajellomyces capsulatus (strain H88) TaxID=544711 RepID=A0A8A1LQP6_AJEC8|nr:hypothetical protein I7I53_04846 [Histoplasma capsulatum var. duboisii H88]
MLERRCGISDRTNSRCSLWVFIHTPVANMMAHGIVYSYLFQVLRKEIQEFRITSRPVEYI